MEAILTKPHSQSLPGDEVLPGNAAAGTGIGDVVIGGANIDLDGVHGAVQEDGGRVGGLDGQVAHGTVEAGDEDVVLGALIQLDADQVAELVQNHIVLAIGQQGVVVLVQGIGIIVAADGLLVLGAGNGNLVGNLGRTVSAGQRELGDSAVLQDLGLPNGDNLAIVHIVLEADVGQIEGILSHIGDLGNILNVDVVGLAGVGGLNSPDLDGSGLLGLQVIGAGLGQPGVDRGDDDGLTDILVNEHLSQNAAAAEADIVLVVAAQNVALLGDVLIAGIAAADNPRGHAAVLVGLNTVEVVDQTHVLVAQQGVAQQIVHVTAANANVVLLDQQRPVNEGADLFLVIDPGVSGTHELIVAQLLLELAEVLLSELDDVILADVVDPGLLRVPLAALSAARGQGDLHAVDGGGQALVVLNQVGLQGVERVQAGLLAVHGLDAVELALDAVLQADVDGLLGNVDGPVVANIALEGGVIAQSAQQHLHEGIAGQGVAGTESAVGVTTDDAFLLAVGDVAGELAGYGDVAVGGGVCVELSRGGGPQDHVADDLGSGAASQVVTRLEVAARVTINNFDGGDHVDGFFVGDVTVVRELLGAGVDRDERHHHDQRQHQRKELSHLGLPPFRIWRGCRQFFVKASDRPPPGAHTVASRNPYLLRPWHPAFPPCRNTLPEPGIFVYRFALVVIQVINGGFLLQKCAK